MKIKITNDRELISLFNDKISTIYYEKDIVPLRGFSDGDIDFPYKLPNGKNFINHINEVLRNTISTKEIIDISEDLLFLSDEIIYFIALLYLHQPYIENQIENGINTDHGEFYIADQTIEGKRYDMFVDILFEKIFSFYERIAKIIVLFFPNLFPKSENIHFSTTMDKLNSCEFKNDDFSWLIDFRNKEFKEMNKQRRDAVHNISTVTKNWNEQRFDNFMNYSQTKELQEKRINYADYFKKFHNLCLEGLEKSLDFLYTNKQNK